MRKASIEFWYFLVGGINHKGEGVFGNFYSYGLHCGDALHKALISAEENEIKRPNAVEAMHLDNFENYKAPKDVIKVAADVLMRPTIHSYDLSKEQEFIQPTGIIKSTDESEYDYELIKECFVAYNKNENGIFEFELVANKEKLADTFIKTISFLPSVDGF